MRDNVMPAECGMDGLSMGFLNGWMHNFTMVVDAVKASFAPHVPLLAFHTTVLPRYEDPRNVSGLSVEWLHGRYLATHQLNEAGKHIARKLHMVVVDMAQMAGGLVPQRALRDTHHPSKVVLQETWNLYLNIMAHRFKHTGYFSTTATK